MHNFKKMIRTVCILIVSIAVFFALDYILYPCTFTRNDIHAVTSGQYDDIYMGTSHGKMDIDPQAMEAVSGRTGHNLCVGGEYSEDAYYLARLILEKGYRPSRIIYEVSPGYFTSEKEEGNNYLLFYHEFPLSRSKLEYFWDSVRDCNFRTMLFPWYEYPLSYELENIRDTVSKKWTGDFGTEDLKSDSQEYHESGFVERYPVDTESLAMTGISEFHKEDVAERNMTYLKKLIQLCRENDIEFIALVTPMPGDTLAAYAESFSEAYQYFGEFFAENEVRYINFNSDQLYPVFTHDLSAYTDYDGHLHGDAARDFSEILAQVLDNTYEFPTAGGVEEETEAAG
ncbi:MAG: hypothetical protein Q4C91_20460 [Eubacteriales bacterium]|nr:hypothetical protein [Eubacteriales bacterium]